MNANLRSWRPEAMTQTKISSTRSRGRSGGHSGMSRACRAFETNKRHLTKYPQNLGSAPRPSAGCNPRARNTWLAALAESMHPYAGFMRAPAAL